MMSKELEEQSFEQLLPQIKHEQKRAFLERYTSFGVSRLTADAIGIAEKTLYNWLNKDKLFNTAFTALKKEIQTHRIEIHEKNIHDVALDTKTPPQSRIFGSLVALRAEAPDKYREKAIEHKFTGDIIIRTAIPRPDYPQIEATKQIGNAIQE